jgi:hypothetical protein
MSANQTQSPDPKPTLPWKPLCWPWGQFGAFLLAMCVFVMGMETLIVYVAVYAHLISPPDTHEASWLQLFVSLLVLAAVSCAVIAFATWGLRRVRKLPPAIRWPRLRVLSGVLFAVGILAQTIALSFPAAVAARKAQQQAAAEGQWQETVFSDGAIRISTPQSWEVVPNPKAPASSVHMVERQSGSGLTAVLVPRQDLAFQSLTDFSKSSGALLAESLTNPKSIKVEPGELEGYPTIDTVQTGALSNVNLVWQSRYIEYPDAWFELRMWITPSRHEMQPSIFDRIAASIRRGK